MKLWLQITFGVACGILIAVLTLCILGMLSLHLVLSDYNELMSMQSGI